MCTQRKTYKLNWYAPGWRDKRSLKHQRAVELGATRGQKAERKQTKALKCSCIKEVETARHLLTFLTSCLFSLSLWLQRALLFFPPVVLILKDLTSFVNPLERYRSFFFLFANMCLSCKQLEAWLWNYNLMLGFTRELTANYSKSLCVNTNKAYLLWKMILLLTKCFWSFIAQATYQRVNEDKKWVTTLGSMKYMFHFFSPCI